MVVSSSSRRHSELKRRESLRLRNCEEGEDVGYCSESEHDPENVPAREEEGRRSKRLLRRELFELKGQEVAHLQPVGAVKPPTIGPRTGWKGLRKKSKRSARSSSPSFVREEGELTPRKGARAKRAVARPRS